MSLDYLPRPIKRFIHDIPKVLSLHRETADLAVQIENMNLPAQFQYKFTLAVVGQMKAGKSTLLNALIEKDVAPVGVNECTATVNRFMLAPQKELLAKFRVHWKDGSIEDLPIHRIRHWVGKGDNVDQTRRLDFFFDAPRLGDVNIIDTPGLRSTIDAHEENAISVLNASLRETRIASLEKETIKGSDLADAIIYVLSPIVKKNDQQVLDLFSDNSRLSGAHAYNSIAVIQKWEQLWSDPDMDILREVQRKCDLLQKQLEGKVAEVVPVSGLLARCLSWLPDDIWERMIELGKSPHSAMKKITSGEEPFREDVIEFATMSVAARKQLYEDVFNSLKNFIDEHAAKATRWTIVSFLAKLAYKEKISNLDDFKNTVRKLSGIDKLIKIIQDRFFQRAALIKTGVLLHRVWEPCEIGIARLDLLESRRQRTIREGEVISRLLQERIQWDETLHRVFDYVSENLHTVRDNLKAANAHKKALYTLKSQVQRFFEDFNRDLYGLELLDSKDVDLSFSEEEQLDLRGLFGAKGVSATDRLRIEENSFTRQYLLDIAQTKLSFWAAKEYKSFGKDEKLCTLAQDRLKYILDELDATSER